MAKCVTALTHTCDGLSQISSTHIKSQARSVRLYPSAVKVKIIEPQHLSWLKQVSIRNIVSNTKWRANTKGVCNWPCVSPHIKHICNLFRNKDLYNFRTSPDMLTHSQVKSKANQQMSLNITGKCSECDDFYFQAIV